MGYNLTEKQQQGLDICFKRYYDEEDYTIIAGYAGTGKSYLVNAIVDKFGFSEKEVAYACYTGKASLVLQNQGKNATTLHRLLYVSYPNGRGGFVNKPRKSLNPNLKLIIVDEISMCPKELWRLLLKHRIYIIGLGDPFQLPPIGNDLHLLDKCDIFLDEVMRQALDNDIIKYSMELREGKKLTAGIRGDNIQTYTKSEFNNGMMLWADQILCGKNDTRHRINTDMRRILEKKNIIDKEEKLICVRNYWNIASENGNFLVNGTIGMASNISLLDKIIQCNFLVDNNYFEKLTLDYKLLTTGEKTVLKNGKGKILPNPYIEMEYGYAITVHKSQGSQFEKVLVYDDYWTRGIDYQRWLYTAITRAVDKVVVIL